MPHLDEACGQFFTFRQFIECGQTWQDSGRRIVNVPVQTETWEAIKTMCRVVLDPVAAEFGQVRLTYAFSSSELSAEIRRRGGRIDPSRDQHAGYELRQKGKAVCLRLGFAVDLIVDNRSSRDVGRWISENTAFDQLCFFGDDKPIHVSVGPKEMKQAIEIGIDALGRRTKKGDFHAPRRRV